jgi:hypothetical protein
MPETPNRPPAIQIRDKGRLEEERLRVLRLVSEAESALRDVRAGVEDGRKLFLPTQGYTLPQKAPYPGATEAFVALVATNVEQLAARITQTLCGADVYVLVQPESAEDRDDAAMAQMFLQTQAEQQLQLRDKVIRPLVYATLTSKVGIAYVGWEERRRKRTFWRQVREYQPYGDEDPRWQTLEAWAEEGLPIQPVDGVSGWFQHPQTGEWLYSPLQGPIPDGERGARDRWDKATESVLEYDGPDIRLIPIDRFGWHPAQGADLQECGCVFYRVNLSGATIQQRVAAGEYDAAFLKALQQWPGDANERATPADTQEGIATETAVDTPFHSRTFDLVVAHAWYSDENDGEAQDYVYTIHEGANAVACAKANEWWDGERHFVVMRAIPNGEGILGASVPETHGSYQDALTRLLRAAITAAERQANPSLLVDHGALSPAEEEMLKEGLSPGGVKFMQGKPADVIHPWQAAMPASSVLPVQEFVQNLADQRLGVTPTRRGAVTAGDKTKYEIEAALSEGDVGLSMMVNECGLAVAQLMEFVQRMDYQMIGHESIQKLWFLANPRYVEQVDPQTGQKVPVLDEAGNKIPDMDAAIEDAMRVLGKRYHIAAAGSTDSANGELLRARIIQAFPLLAQGPYTNQYELYRRLVAALRLGDPDALIGTEDEAQQKDQARAQVEQAQAEIALTKEQLEIERGKMELTGRQQQMEQLARKEVLDTESHEANLRKQDDERAFREAEMLMRAGGGQ